jgi:16S rRNA (cytosine1402-N4)-methyltransferase
MFKGLRFSASSVVKKQFTFHNIHHRPSIMRASHPVLAGAFLLFSTSKTSSFTCRPTASHTSRFFSSGTETSFGGEEFSTEYHSPVMWKECIAGLLECEQSRKIKGSDDTRKPLLFIDGTLGGGGHSNALLDRLQAGDIVFGCDVDPDALQTASNRLQKYMDHNCDEYPLFIPVQTNFGDLASSIPKVLHPVTKEPVFQTGVDGILLDFGVSSHQIDTPERGFAFMKNGPLDMRMSGTSKSGLTAADICNEFDQRELQRIFSRYGDEPRAKTVSKAIIDNRPLSTTKDLVDAISSVTATYAKRKRMGLTATCARVFQSLRIVVNAEDSVLERVLSDACPTLIHPGGRLVVLSYHSMEDRATKRIMRDGTLDRKKNHRDERDIYGNYIGPPKPFKPVGKRQKAPEEEVEVNSRARSAVLRIAEKQ